MTTRARQLRLAVPVALVLAAGIVLAWTAAITDARPETKRSIRRQLAHERVMWAAERRRLHAAIALRVITAPTLGLALIASCESGGNPRALSPGGKYRGKYQFDRRTWRGTGGMGDPAAAPEPEQDYRAWRLYARRGAHPWPVCGRR